MLKSPEIKREGPSSGLRQGILIIEDDFADSTLLTKQLLSLGFTSVTVASTISEATQLIFSPPEGILPLVIFSDISLPDGDARDHVQEWREKLGRETLIVMTTGSVRPEELQAAYRKGADTFLAKPVSKADIENLKNFYVRFFETA